MNSYWSCSKFSDKLRTLFNMPKKLNVGTSSEWEEWKNISKKNKLGYFVVEVLLDKIQETICYPYNVLLGIRIYIRNRFVSKIHYLQTGLIPGQYYDLDHRLLHGNFNSLVDFVEVEKAHMSIICDADEKIKLPWYKKYKLLNWKEFRSANLGIKYLDWEITLTYDKNEYESKEPPDVVKTSQALAAIEIKELYNWWKFVRPNRPDPHEISGMMDFYDDDLFLSRLKNSNFSKSAKKAREIEEQYDKEDTEMLIRLIKIRQSLWT